jgi:hypothetical protein
MNEKYTGRISDYINTSSPYVMLMYEVEKKYWNSKVNHTFKLPVSSQPFSEDSEASLRSLEGVTAYKLESQNAKRQERQNPRPIIEAAQRGQSKDLRKQTARIKVTDKSQPGSSSLKMIFNHSFQNGRDRFFKQGLQVKTESFTQPALKGNHLKIGNSPSAKFSETSIRSSTNQPRSASKTKRGTETSSWRIAKVDITKAALTNRSKLGPREANLKSDSKFFEANKRSYKADERSEKSSENKLFVGSRYLETVGTKDIQPLMSIKGLARATEDPRKVGQTAPMAVVQEKGVFGSQSKSNWQVSELSTSRPWQGKAEVARPVQKGALFTDLRKMQQGLRAREQDKAHGQGLAIGGGQTSRYCEHSYFSKGLTSTRLPDKNLSLQSTSHQDLPNRTVKPQILVHVPQPYSSHSNLQKKQGVKVDVLYDRPINSKLFSTIKTKLTTKTVN